MPKRKSERPTPPATAAATFPPPLRRTNAGKKLDPPIAFPPGMTVEDALRLAMKGKPGKMQKGK